MNDTLFVTLYKSFTYKKNSKGPSIEPCRTPFDDDNKQTKLLWRTTVISIIREEGRTALDQLAIGGSKTHS